MKVGFIGLGIMGKPMAKNLIKGGHELKVYDLNTQRVNELAQTGAHGSGSVQEAAKDVDVVITMLPNSPHVKEVVCGPDGVLSVAKPGTILIDMSSIAPAASQEVAQACAEKGVKMLEAPVSGGEPKAIDGTVSFMCGGDADVFEYCKPLLSLMGKDIVLCGGNGSGNTVKLANQIIVAVNIAAVAEAFMLARQAGVAPEIVLDAIKGGLAGSTVLNAKGSMMIAQNTNPGFKIDLHIKDLNNAIDTAHKNGTPIPMTSMVMDMMQNLHARNMGNCDHSAIAKYYEHLTGINI